MAVILFIVLGLAVARLTRLWRDDVIFEAPREGLGEWLAKERRHGSWLAEKIGYLIECPWCLAGWLAIAAVVVVDTATSRSVEMPWLSWLAVWWVANAAYFLLELIADRDALLYWERENKGID